MRIERERRGFDLRDCRERKQLFLIVVQFCPVSVGAIHTAIHFTYYMHTYIC